MKEGTSIWNEIRHFKLVENGSGNKEEDKKKQNTNNCFLRLKIYRYLCSFTIANV
jgi:hypothetical protein